MAWNFPGRNGDPWRRRVAGPLECRAQTTHPCRARLVPLVAERMRHLIISREYPPAPYPMGGIGTYVRHVARLLAEAGEEVHVIAQRFAAAPEPTTTSVGGRLTVHRVPLDAPLEQLAPAARPEHRVALATLATTRVPALAFAWQAAALAEWLVEQVGIDLMERPEH